jgi:hypothetical protein
MTRPPAAPVGRRPPTLDAVRLALTRMRDEEMKLDDFDLLNETPAYERAMAAAREYHAVLEAYEAAHGRLTP